MISAESFDRFKSSLQFLVNPNDTTECAHVPVPFESGSGVWNGNQCCIVCYFIILNILPDVIYHYFIQLILVLLSFRLHNLSTVLRKAFDVKAGLNEKIASRWEPYSLVCWIKCLIPTCSLGVTLKTIPNHKVSKFRPRWNFHRRCKWSICNSGNIGQNCQSPSLIELLKAIGSWPNFPNVVSKLA